MGFFNAEGCHDYTLDDIIMLKLENSLKKKQINDPGVRVHMEFVLPISLFLWEEHDKADEQ